MLFPVSSQPVCVNYLAFLTADSAFFQLISIVRSAAHNEDCDTAEERAHTSGDISFWHSSLADDKKNKTKKPCFVYHKANSA